MANSTLSGGTLANDVISISIRYPDKTGCTFSDGTLISGTIGKSGSGTGRLKTPTYSFNFGKYSPT